MLLGKTSIPGKIFTARDEAFEALDYIRGLAIDNGFDIVYRLESIV